MQGIFTKVLSLWIPNKTDKGTVVTDVFEPNFTKLDQYAEATNQTLENLKNNKLEKGTYNGKASDLNDEISKVASPTQLGRVKVGNNLKIDEDGFLSGQDVDLSNYYDKPEIEEKFKNFCPFDIGDIYITTLSTSPAVRFLGTTWEKIEGRFLLATSGSNASEQTGGSNTKTITQANLPNVKLQVDRVSATINNHSHFSFSEVGWTTGDSAVTASTYPRRQGAGGWGGGYKEYGIGGTTTIPNVGKTSSDGSGSTGTIAPYTSALGSGTALDITPAYYTVHVWKRLT